MQLLIKFGKKEHLEQLRTGIVHFSRLETFQKDSTAFRGDKMEGKHYIDPSKPFLINGKDISGYVKEATISYEFVNCTVLSFSASLLSCKNSHLISDGIYTPNDDFIAEMKQFGDYFLIFDAVAFINSLRKTLKIAGCGWESHPVIYIDKHNYELVIDYYEKLSVDRKNSAHLFVKDTANAYSIQNEWRMVIFDYGNYYSLDKTGGTNIPTSFFTQMPIFNIDELKTLQCSREFLCT